MRVPEAHRESLTLLASYDDPDAEALLSALEALPPFLPADELGSQVATKAGIAATIADSLVRAGLTLATQTKYHGWTSDDVSQGVVASADLKIDEGRREAAASRVRRLMDSSPIASTARAVDLQTDHERLFHDARVLTDVRPVFGANPAAAPTGAVVNEVLKLEYWEGQDMKQIFVALDRNDILHLKQVIDRAITKTDTLRMTLEAAGLYHFELEGPHE